MIAVAVFTGRIKGTVHFMERDDAVDVKVDITGLKKNALHGFHVHEAGDLTDQCASMCAHFNPYGKKHGGPDDRLRHVGDLGESENKCIG